MKKKGFEVFLIFLFSILIAAVFTIIIDSISVRKQYKKIEPNLDNYSMAEMLYLSLEKSRSALVLGGNFEHQRKVFIGRLNIIDERTKDNESYRSDPAFVSALSTLRTTVDKYSPVVSKQSSYENALMYLDQLEEDVLDLQESVYAIQVKDFKSIQNLIKGKDLKLNFLICASLFSIISIILLVVRYSSAMEGVLRKKNVFISSLYHELASSIQSISMAVEILEDEILQPNIANELKIISVNCNKIFEQTKEVMEYSRFELGDVKVKNDIVNIKSIANEAVNSVSGKNNQFKVFVSQAKHDLLIDKYKLLRVIINLLDNANKFTSNGMILLHIKYKRGFIYVRVKDDGCGFNTKQLKDLYRPFRTGNDIKTKQGLGLGLAIIKNNVDIMNGVIRVRSSCGKGTVFLIRLPTLLDKE
ncbi:UNVERIFIED_ORG: histidine kinase/DNA gyrase B/HSP90-like ATPase [Citrobacter freundii]